MQEVLPPHCAGKFPRALRNPAHSRLRSLFVERPARRLETSARHGWSGNRRAGHDRLCFLSSRCRSREAERKRCLHLNQIGRIAEGQIVDLVERPPESKEARKGLFGSSSRPLKDMRPRHFVSYSYLISGVSYHTAQDITGLESQVRLERLVAGQPASIKYDAANPSDSILVADDWSGLR